MDRPRPGSKPDLAYELGMTGPVAGVDECGRGPLAGPVVAAAVILDHSMIPDGINDSKKLSRRMRERLFDGIQAAAWLGIGSASVEEIDRHNILAASLLAMRRAVAALPRMPAACLVDGNADPDLGLPTRLIVRGDQRSLSIAAASIVAKVTRDRLMGRLAQDYPSYGWHRNAGYGVPEHRKALELVGVSPHHRKSFAPIRKLLNQDHLLTS